MTFGCRAIMSRYRCIFRRYRNARKDNMSSLQLITDEWTWSRGSVQWCCCVDACSIANNNSPAKAYVHCSTIDTRCSLPSYNLWSEYKNAPIIIKVTISLTSIRTFSFNIIYFIKWQGNVDFVLQTSSPHVIWNTKPFMAHDESLPR